MTETDLDASMFDSERIYEGTRSISIALGQQIRKIRKSQKLTSVALGAQSGIHYSRLSRLERGLELCRVDEVKAILSVLKVDPATAEELTLMAHDLSEKHLVWVTTQPNDTRPLSITQSKIRKAYESVRHLRCFEPLGIHGLLQTAQYIDQVFEQPVPWKRNSVGISNEHTHLNGFDVRDISAAKASRLAQQEVLFDMKKRFDFILMESSFRTWLGPTHVIVGQINKISILSFQPNLRIGVIPQDTHVPILPLTNFRIYDDRNVQIEHLGGRVGIRSQRLINLYVESFEMLDEVALHDDDVREWLRELAAEFVSQADIDLSDHHSVNAALQTP